MLPIANTALDFHILELLLRIIPNLLLLLAILLPRDARPEDDILPHARSIEGRARSVAFLETEFRPGATFGDAWVHGLFFDGGADPTCGFDTLAAVVEAVGYHGFGAVFVCGYGLGWKGVGVCVVCELGLIGRSLWVLTDRRTHRHLPNPGDCKEESVSSSLRSPVLQSFILRYLGHIGRVGQICCCRYVRSVDLKLLRGISVVI